MRYYVIAGEASGDLHGSNLLKALKQQDPEMKARCWGGDMMAAQGGDVVKDYKDLAFMGFIEVIANLNTIVKNLKFCKQDILDFKPDVIVLIDYPGFNIRIATWAKEKGFRVVYYISPQVWAWKAGRVKTLKKCVDRMLTILPFEKAFYKKYNWDIDYVGHPLVEVTENFEHKNQSIQKDTKLIALLPGSRKQEIEKKLPVMLAASKEFPNYNFIVAKAPSLPVDYYDEMLKSYPNVTTATNETYSVLMRSSAALVTSGTATLETALLDVPQVICYKGSAISFAIAKKLVNIRFIGLANLILDKEVVKELIQHDFNKENVVQELDKILHDESVKKQIHTDYASLKSLLKQGGDASYKAAKIIIETAQLPAQ